MQYSTLTGGLAKGNVLHGCSFPGFLFADVIYKKHRQVLKIIVHKHFDNIDKIPFEKKDLIKRTDGLYIGSYKHVLQIDCDNIKKSHMLEVHTRSI